LDGGIKLWMVWGFREREGLIAASRLLRISGFLAALILKIILLSYGAFFGYNAAKILLGLAAIVFGMAKMKDGNKALGGVTLWVGAAAFPNG